MVLPFKQLFKHTYIVWEVRNRQNVLLVLISSCWLGEIRSSEFPLLSPCPLSSSACKTYCLILRHSEGIFTETDWQKTGNAAQRKALLNTPSHCNYILSEKKYERYLAHKDLKEILIGFILPQTQSKIQVMILTSWLNFLDVHIP